MLVFKQLFTFLNRAVPLHRVASQGCITNNENLKKALKSCLIVNQKSVIQVEKGFIKFAWEANFPLTTFPPFYERPRKALVLQMPHG